jgi:hypothetical protein
VVQLGAVEARNGLDDHGFSGLRLRTARERDASRALPQCVATVPLKASRGTTSYYMPVQPLDTLRPFAGLALVRLLSHPRMRHPVSTTAASPAGERLGQHTTLERRDAI